MNPARHRAGFALVIVLSCLALVTLLAVSFFLGARVELAAASGYQSSFAARQLAGRAVALVEGQINLAVSGSGEAWCSQPGLVRTYDRSGALARVYKLYAAEKMIDGELAADADQAPDDWAEQPAVWTDLNAPARAAGGGKAWPIVDPSSLDAAVAQRPAGFELDSPPGATAWNPAPMPVKWLYVLRDGSLVAPAAAQHGVTVSGAGPDNPVVGRVAFWTDDETCKVNLNTAGEGLYWDTPRFDSGPERRLAWSQPVATEYQRQPGHPAMTSLSAVFPDLSVSELLALTPAWREGGSRGGTVPTPAATPVVTGSDRRYASVGELLFSATVSGTVRTTNPTLTRERLARARFFLTAHSRAPEVNLFNLPRIACWPIHRLNDSGRPDLQRTTADDRLVALCAATGTLPFIFQRENALSATNDINLPRNRELYGYLQWLAGQEIPGCGGNFTAKYGADRDQILTEIFDYIRAANAWDASWSATEINGSTAANPNAYASRANSGATTSPPSGAVIPTAYNGTRGLGRMHTLSKISLAFICNAQGGDHPSNQPANNLLLRNSGTAPLTLGDDERFVQAVLVPEFFCPALGVGASLQTNLLVTIRGLNNLAVMTAGGTTARLFPNLDDERVSYTNEWRHNAGDTLAFGGPQTYRAMLLGKGVPERSILSGAAGATTMPGDPAPGRPGGRNDVAGYFTGHYPYYSHYVKIRGPNVELVKGATLTVELRNQYDQTLLQTLTVTFPAGVFPAPRAADDAATNYGNLGETDRNQARSWWFFQASQQATGAYGRLFYINSSAGNAGSDWPGAVFRPKYDTIRSVLTRHGDYRLTAASATVPDTAFVPHRWYADGQRHLASALNHTLGMMNFSGLSLIGSGTAAVTVSEENERESRFISGVNYDPLGAPDLPVTFFNNAGGLNTPESTGDFDNGLAGITDGPYINYPDAGDRRATATAPPDTLKYSELPYYRVMINPNNAVMLNGNFAAPSRLIPSPVMFGSLPTGVKAGAPWQTLLFRRQPEHPKDRSRLSGSAAVQDHLLLDWFWMPVTRPRPVSNSLATEGKINLNYQLWPFTHVKRATALHALLKAERVIAVPRSRAAKYTGSAMTASNAENDSFVYRLPVNIPATLAQCEEKFAAGGAYVSASEICDLHLVPQHDTLALSGASSQAAIDQAMRNFWREHALTGDNSRERIYATVYPRLTTKSNTFTVHVRAQILRPAAGADPSGWQERAGAVLSEYRGATVIERFIDADRDDFPDYARQPSDIPRLTPLHQFYRWRVLEETRFIP